MIGNITCVITDDEPFARKGLQGYVEKTDFLDLKGMCEDAVELSNLLQQQPVDLLFLDIQMPYMNGIEFLKAIPHPPKVIFTTAFEKYAIQGFDLDVMDYLLKPISYDRFLKAAWKARDFFSSRKEPPPNVPYVFVKSNGKLEKINFSDILFIKGMENYVTIHLTDKKVVTHITIKSFFEKLPAGQFIQTHKSYIVAIGKVDSVEGNILHIGENQVQVSKSQREAVLKQIVKG